MELFDTTQLGLHAALHGASVRQSAIAGNLANANTPGYRRQDADFHGALQAAFARGREAVEEVEIAAAPDGSAPVRQDGGTVDPDVEATASARNGLEYQAIAAVIKARTDIVKSAIGVG